LLLSQIILYLFHFFLACVTNAQVKQQKSEDKEMQSFLSMGIEAKKKNTYYARTEVINKKAKYKLTGKKD